MTRINPYKAFTGSFIPNWLLEREEISASAKLVYARLAQYAGKSGIAFPKHTKLAENTGMSRSTVIRAIKELEKQKLIESVRVGIHKSNRYYFLEHSWILNATRTNSSKLQMYQNDTSKSVKMTQRKVSNRHPFIFLRESVDNIPNGILSTQENPLTPKSPSPRGGEGDFKNSNGLFGNKSDIHFEGYNAAACMAKLEREGEFRLLKKLKECDALEYRVQGGDKACEAFKVKTVVALKEDNIPAAKRMASKWYRRLMKFYEKTCDILPEALEAADSGG